MLERRNNTTNGSIRYRGRGSTHEYQESHNYVEMEENQANGHSDNNDRDYDDPQTNLDGSDISMNYHTAPINH